MYESRVVESYDWGVLQRMKDEGRKIVALTAYSARQAHLIAPWVDFMLVGDSVAMVWHKHKTTQAATVEMMVRHGGSVVGASYPLTPVVVDMPECAYKNKSDALRFASEIMKKTGCQAVKLEGGVEMAETVQALVERGIPVMGHIGLLPSKFGADDKYCLSGKGQKAAQKLVNDAKAIQEAGAFAVVIEGSMKPVVDFIVANVLTIPSIGIGASPNCSGQILVNRDIWGKPEDWRPKFAKCFRQPGKSRQEAVIAYAKAVRSGAFPDAQKNCYHPNVEKDGPIDVYALG